MSRADFLHDSSKPVEVAPNLPLPFMCYCPLLYYEISIKVNKIPLYLLPIIRYAFNVLVGWSVQSAVELPTLCPASRCQSLRVIDGLAARGQMCNYCTFQMPINGPGPILQLLQIYFELRSFCHALPCASLPALPLTEYLAGLGKGSIY